MKIETNTNDDLSNLLKTNFYKIGDMAKLLGVHQQTLRNWERKKLIKPIRVGKIRIYTDEHIEKCKLIKSYSEKGISLAGIKALLDNGVVIK
jgi:MerR family transcriptional regulator/heat shock protein HspR